MGGFIVKDPEQIRLLGSPIRQDIVDYLDAVGPSTMAELGRGVGVPPDRLYYHVDMLLEAGLLVRHDGAGDRAMVLALPGGAVTLRYQPDDPAVVEAVQDAIGIMLRSTGRRFDAALEGEVGRVRVDGPERNVWATRVRGRLDRDDLREVNELVARIHEIFAEGRGRPDAAGRMHEVTVVLSPLADAVS